METSTRNFKILWELYATFFKIGLFMFGGGYAMLPLLEKECVEKKGWTDKEEILDIFALAQCTPGIISVNTATYLGRKKGGFLGALAATLGDISPSLIIIITIAAVLQNFADIPNVQHAMAAIRVTATALIFASVLKMAKGAFQHWLQPVLAGIAFLLVALFGTSPVIIVVASALVGFVAFGGIQWKKASAEKEAVPAEDRVLAEEGKSPTETEEEDA